MKLVSNQYNKKKHCDTHKTPERHIEPWISTTIVFSISTTNSKSGNKIQSGDLTEVIHWLKYGLKTKSKNHFEKAFLNLMKNYVFTKSEGHVKNTEASNL